MDSHRFQYARGPLKSRITNYVRCSTKTIKKFKAAADGMISKRNRAFHPVSVQEVDGLVQRAKDAIHACPQIRVELTDECFILDDYDSMKREFPNV